jgi:hypothetical protein
MSSRMVHPVGGGCDTTSNVLSFSPNHRFWTTGVPVDGPTRADRPLESDGVRWILGGLPPPPLAGPMAECEHLVSDVVVVLQTLSDDLVLEFNAVHPEEVTVAPLVVTDGHRWRSALWLPGGSAITSLVAGLQTTTLSVLVAIATRPLQCAGRMRPVVTHASCSSSKSWMSSVSMVRGWKRWKLVLLDVACTSSKHGGASSRWRRTKAGSVMPARQGFHGRNLGEEELLRDADVVHPHRAKLLALLGACHLSLSLSFSIELG